MKTTLISLALILPANSFSIPESDTFTSIAVYRIKSEVVSSEFTNTLSDHVESRLLGFATYRVIARSNLDVLITEDHIRQSGVTQEETGALQNGTLSTVEKVCTGSVSRVGTNYSFTLKTIDVRSGRIEASAQRIYEGPAEGLLGIADTLVNQLYGRPGKLSKIDSASASMAHRGAALSVPADGDLEKSRGIVSAKVSTEPVITPAAGHIPSPSGSGSSMHNSRVQKVPPPEKRPSNLGKRISIGAVVIFATLSALLLITRN